MTSPLPSAHSVGQVNSPTASNVATDTTHISTATTDSQEGGYENYDNFLATENTTPRELQMQTQITAMQTQLNMLMTTLAANNNNNNISGATSLGISYDNQATSTASTQPLSPRESLSSTRSPVINTDSVNVSTVTKVSSVKDISFTETKFIETIKKITANIQLASTLTTPEAHSKNNISFMNNYNVMMRAFNLLEREDQLNLEESAHDELLQFWQAVTAARDYEKEALTPIDLHFGLKPMSTYGGTFIEKIEVIKDEIDLIQSKNMIYQKHLSQNGFVMTVNNITTSKDPDTISHHISQSLKAIKNTPDPHLQDTMAQHLRTILATTKDMPHSPTCCQSTLTHWNILDSTHNGRVTSTIIDELIKINFTTLKEWTLMQRAIRAATKQQPQAKKKTSDNSTPTPAKAAATSEKTCDKCTGKYIKTCHHCPAGRTRCDKCDNFSTKKFGKDKASCLFCHGTAEEKKKELGGPRLATLLKKALAIDADK
jgi:hypothetical protein